MPQISLCQIKLAKVAEKKENSDLQKISLTSTSDAKNKEMKTNKEIKS